MDTMALTNRNAEKIKVTQRAKERRMLHISLRDRIRYAEIGKRTGVTDDVLRG